MGETDLGNIKLLVLDVDGVMTDGKIILTPAGDELKEFNVRDGAAMKWWQRLGKQIALISGRSSPAILRRGRDLGVQAIRIDAKDKLPVYRSVLAELGVSADQVAVMGDDLPDLPLMRNCALAIAVADASDEVVQAASYVTTRMGGQGAVREAIEMILRGSGQWPMVLKRYQEDQ